MTVSAKCYYALRAIYALAEHQGSVPLKANEIADAAAYTDQVSGGDTEPVEGGGGYVTSRRGVGGGISAVHAPADRLMIGEIIRFIDGPIAPVDCVSVSSPPRNVNTRAIARFSDSGAASVRRFPTSSIRRPSLI